MAVLRGQRGPLQQLHTVTKLTGTPRDNRRHLKYPDCRWIIMPLGRYEELHLSCLFSSSGSGSGSSVGSDLLIALWKILYH